MFSRHLERVLNSSIDVISWSEALQTIQGWASRHESRYICICNVHSVVTATQDSELERVINEADLATPDGAPIAWMLRRFGSLHQQRINGPDLMLKYCEQAALRGDTSSVFHLEAAFDKAYTAVTTRADTSALLPRQKAGTLPPVMTRPLEHLMVAQGGIVVKVGDETVAAIGVSGSPNGGQNDEDCARAGLDRIRDRLKT